MVEKKSGQGADVYETEAGGAGFPGHPRLHEILNLTRKVWKMFPLRVKMARPALMVYF